jgi:hypothetical protein
MMAKIQRPPRSTRRVAAMLTILQSLSLVFPNSASADYGPFYVGTKVVHVEFGYWTSDISSVAGNDSRILVGQKVANLISDHLANKGIQKTVISTKAALEQAKRENQPSELLMLKADLLMRRSHDATYAVVVTFRMSKKIPQDPAPRDAYACNCGLNVSTQLKFMQQAEIETADRLAHVLYRQFFQQILKPFEAEEK